MKAMTGLLTKKRNAIPLLGVRVSGDLVGRGAKITIAQRYRNTESKPVEAVYKFPLPEGCAIAGFRARNGDRLIEGQVEERDQAFNQYDDALAEGNGAYLMDQERPNIFTLSVGNLNPGGDVTVEIDLVMLLDAEGPKYRLTMPTTISPRYLPADMPDRDGIPAAELVTPEYAFRVPYGLTLALNIHGKKPAGVESPSHPIRVNMNAKITTVQLSAETTQMDRDFVLIIDPGKEMTGRAYYCTGDRYSYVQLDLMIPEPDNTQATDPGEIIFLLDCSGSMYGESIEQAKKALEICLKALPGNCKFNIYRFGSSFNSIFAAPRPYSEENLTAALRELERTDADLGGTEMLSPFKAIYKASGNNSARSIIMLTDGEVGNEQELQDLAAKHRDHTRVFPIGIGSGPNEHLIKGLARSADGCAEFVYPGERIEPKVLRIFSGIGGAFVSDLHIHWGDDQAEQAPSRQAVFAGRPTTFFARTANNAQSLSKIRVSGTMGGQPVEWLCDVQPAESKGLPLPQLWARERIRDMEEQGTASGSRQERRKEHTQAERIIELSKAYGILSGQTSYLGIEKRTGADKTTEAAELRKVPTLVTTGWQGARQNIQYMRSSCVVADMMDFSETFERPVFTKAIKLRKMIHDETDVLMDLLAAQQINGGFLLDKKLAKALHFNFKQLREQANRLTGVDKDAAFLIVCTVLVFEILSRQYMDQLGTWLSVTEKSRHWLDNTKSTALSPEAYNDLVTWAGNLVAQTVPAPAHH